MLTDPDPLSEFRRLVARRSAIHWPLAVKVLAAIDELESKRVESKPAVKRKTRRKA